MDDNITKIIKEKFDALPQSIQEMILSTNYQDTLIEIGKQYQLNVEQMGILERETTLVMMGLTPTKNFEVELTRELHVDKFKGSQIVKDINEKIFLRIRELLKLMNTPKGEEPSLENSPPEKYPLEGSGQIYPPRLSATPQEGNKNDTTILNKAGIEIIPGKLELANGEKPIENREDILKKIEKPEEVHPILAQKLSGSLQTPVIKTEHSLENLTKTNTPIPQKPQTYPKNLDPYREMPE